MGIPPEMFGKMTEASVVEVWPQNWRAFLVFAGLGTQWRVGMNGATGLDYSAVWATLNALVKSAQKRKKIFAQIRVMESAALELMSERRDPG